MSKEILIPYAFNKSKDNKLESAFEADKKYVYVCPCCGEQLILKQGKIKIHHFSHPKNSECNANAAGQTSMHYKSKEFFQDAVLKGQNHIKIPIYKGEYFKNQYIDFCYTNVKIERRLGDIIPDIILENDKGEQVLIEITVTHGIDDNKLSKLEKLQFPCMEYDLSKLYESVGTKFDEKLLYNVIINFDTKNEEKSLEESKYRWLSEREIIIPMYKKELIELFSTSHDDNIIMNNRFNDCLDEYIVEEILIEENELNFDEKEYEYKSIDGYFDNILYIDWYNRLNNNASYNLEILENPSEMIKLILEDKTTCNFLNKRRKIIKEICNLKVSKYTINNKVYRLYTKCRFLEWEELTEKQKKYIKDLRTKYITDTINELKGLDKEIVQLNIELLQYLIFFAESRFYFNKTKIFIAKSKDDAINHINHLERIHLL